MQTRFACGLGSQSKLFTAVLSCSGYSHTIVYPGVASQHKLNVLQATTRSMATVSIWPLPATANTTTSISSNSSPTITTTPPTTTTTTPTRYPPPQQLLLLVGQLDSTTVRAAATAAVELAIQPIGKKIDIFFITFINLKLFWIFNNQHKHFMIKNWIFEIFE